MKTKRKLCEECIVSVFGFPSIFHLFYSPGKCEFCGNNKSLHTREISEEHWNGNCFNKKNLKEEGKEWKKK